MPKYSYTAQIPDMTVKLMCQNVEREWGRSWRPGSSLRELYREDHHTGAILEPREDERTYDISCLLSNQDGRFVGYGRGFVQVTQRSTSRVEVRISEETTAPQSVYASSMATWLEKVFGATVEIDWDGTDAPELAATTPAGQLEGDKAPPAPWVTADWYQRLSADDRARYDRLRPYKEEWEAGKVTTSDLAKIFAASYDTIRAWRRRLKERGAPDMDWKPPKQTGGVKGV